MLHDICGVAITAIALFDGLFFLIYAIIKDGDKHSKKSQERLLLEYRIMSALAPIADVLNRLAIPVVIVWVLSAGGAR